MRDGVVERDDVIGEVSPWTEEQYVYLVELAKTAAYGTVRPAGVDIDDLVQEALMWAIQHPRQVVDWLEADDTGRVVQAMKNDCKDYAVKQRALARGDETFIDDHFYSLETLKGFGRGPGHKGLLHYVFDQEAWLTPPQNDGDPGIKSRRDPSENNDWLATLSDVSAALDKLMRNDPKGHALLVLHYKQNYTYEEIGASLTPRLPKVTVSRRIDGAIKKIQQILGGPRPRKDPEEPGWEDGPGGRWVLTNAAARAITSEGYEE